MSVLITGVKILDPASKYHKKVKNVFIEKGRISYIGKEIPAARNIIDGRSSFLTTGWFELRADFGDPGFEYKEDLSSGIKTASASGFTGVALTPNTKPPIQSKNDVKYIQRFNASSVTSLYPMAVVTDQGKGEDLAEMMDAHSAGAVAFSDGNCPLWNTDILVKSLQYARQFDGLIIDRPVDRWISLYGVMNEGIVSTQLGLKGIPNVAEEIAIRRDLDALKYTGGKLHFSLISSAGAVSLIRQAKKQGQKVTCDVSINHLIFTDDMVGDYDTIFKVDPPLRGKKDLTALKKGVSDGTIDAIVSDHRPQDIESKRLEFEYAACGINGMQAFWPALLQLSNHIPLEILIERVTSGPRNVLGLGIPTIGEGQSANLTLVSPKTEWKLDANTNLSKSENSPWFGQKLTGKVMAVFNNDQQIIF